MAMSATRAGKLAWLAVAGILAISLPLPFVALFCVLTCEIFGPNAIAATSTFLVMVLFFTANWWRTRVRNTLINCFEIRKDTSREMQPSTKAL